MESGTVLSNTPHIIENIFKNLSALDLSKCACVNKLWNHFSTVEINQRRKKPMFFYQRLKCSNHKRPHTILLECSLKNAGRFEDELDQQIRNLEVKPAFCIAFANWTLWENFESLFPSHPVSKPKCKRFKKADDTSCLNCFESVIKTALEKRLPHNCQVGLFFGQNIIDKEKHFDRVHTDREVPAISGYFLPDLPQQGIQFCKRRNCNREVFSTINTRNDMKSALVLMERKTLSHFPFRLKQILENFNVFENGIVFPVPVGSLVIPLFFGSNVETAFVNIPISNDKDSRIAEEMESKGAIGLIFTRSYYALMKDLKDFRKEYPLIPIAGLSSPPKYYNNEPQKIMLMSLKY